MRRTTIVAPPPPKPGRRVRARGKTGAPGQHPKKRVFKALTKKRRA